MPSDKIQNVPLCWVTIQGSVDNLCKEKKGKQNVRCPFLYIIFFIYFSFFCTWLEHRSHIIILGQIITIQLLFNTTFFFYSE